MRVIGCDLHARQQTLPMPGTITAGVGPVTTLARMCSWGIRSASPMAALCCAWSPAL